MSTTTATAPVSLESAIADLAAAGATLTGGASPVADASGAAAPAGPPAIFIQTYLEGAKVMVRLLPGQGASLPGFKADDEFSRLNVDFGVLTGFTLGTVFLTRDYRIDSDDSLTINFVKPLFYQKNPWFTQLQPAQKTTEQDVTELCQYCIDFDSEGGEASAREYAALYMAYGLKVDVDKLMEVPELPSTAGTTAGGNPNLFRTLLKSHPEPKIDTHGFYVDKDIWHLLVRNVLRKKNTMILGPTGSGKTEIVELIARACGIPVRIEDMGTITDAQTSLQGVHRINGAGVSEFELAPFAEFLREPGIVLMDEMNRAPLSTGNMLLPCLDSRRYLPIDAAGHGGNRHIPIHEELAFLATANLGSEYSGTMGIDAAVANRFFSVEMTYPPEAMECKVLVNRTGIELKKAQGIVAVAKDIRELSMKGELSNSMSVRHTLDAAGLVADGMDVSKALIWTVIPMFEAGTGGVDERKKVKSIISAH